MEPKQRIIRTLIWAISLLIVFAWAIRFKHASSVSTTPKPAVQEVTTTTPPVLKVAVSADGHITSDGSPATMDSLRASFKTLAGQQGTVWYYQKFEKGMPPAQSMQIMTQILQAATEARLPIRISTQPDYSKFIRLNDRLFPQ